MVKQEHGEGVAERGVVVVICDEEVGARSVISFTCRKTLILSVDQAAPPQCNTPHGTP